MIANSENNIKYQQKIYLLGDLIDPISAPINKDNTGANSGPSYQTISLKKHGANSDHPLLKIFPNIEPYDGKSIDTPIIIFGYSVKVINNIIKDNIHKTYQNSEPIIILNAGEKDINSLLEIIGLEADYKTTENNTTADLYAVDNENSFSFRFAIYPSLDSSNFINSQNHNSENTTIEAFVKWLSNSGKRMNDKIISDKKLLANKVASDSGTSQNDLEGYIKGFNSVHVFPGICRNSFQFSYWIYALHDLNDQSDWFYIRQEGQLYAGGAYWPREIVNPFIGSGYDIKEYYIYSYMMDSYIPGFKKGKINMLRSSPSTTTNKTEVTSGMDWDFSGKLGFESVKPTGNVGVNLHLGNSSTVTIQDCQVINHSLEGDTNAKWIYQFKEVTPYIKFAYVAFDNASPLQQGMFQPINQWLWKLSPEVRSSGIKSFRTTFERDRVSSKGDGIIAFFLGSANHTHEKIKKEYEIQLQFPPILMTDKNMEFDKYGFSKTLDIAVGRNWTATCEETWCHIGLPHKGGTAENTRLHVTVDPNETNTNRIAKIVITTLDAVGYAITEVFQSKY